MSTKHDKGTPSASGTGGAHAAGQSVFEMPLAQLRENVPAAIAHLEAAKALLPGLLTLTAEDRKGSNGKFKAGETHGFYSLIDLAIAKPQYFDGLADKDQGVDPNRFEAELVRDRLERRDLLAQFADPAEEASTMANDSVLHLGELTKPVLGEAYGIAKTLARNNVQVRSAIAGLIDYYAGIARKGAETRAHNKAAAEAAKTPPTK